MLVIFDMDGVLLDTEPIIARAYEEAGAPPAPPNRAEIYSTDWLLPQVTLAEYHAIKKRKNEIYLELLWDAPPLPALYTAKDLYRCGHDVGVLTAAPWPALITLYGMYGGVWPFAFSAGEMTIDDKVEVMRSLGPGGVYIDDHDREAKVTEAGWGFVHYTGQSADDLWEEIACVSP